MAATIAAVQSPEADGDLAFGRDDKDDGPVGWTASEEECDLMIDALHRELDGIKNQLAWLTYHLDENPNEREEDGGVEGKNDRERPEPPIQLASSNACSKLSGTRSGADTPHTAAKKVEKAREDLEKAARAALIEKERKRYYMRVVDKAEEEQRVFHDKYLQLMQLRVEQQRQQVQEASKRLCRKMKNRERREKALRLQNKPNHFRSHISDSDTAFLNKLYQSTFYQIIGIENKMKRAGKLKTLTDLKEFWNLMLDPVDLSHDARPVAQATRHSLTQEKEDREEEETGEYVSWALTSLPPEHHVVVCDRESEGATRTRVEPLRLPQVGHFANILNCGSPATTQLMEKRKAHRRKMQAMEISRQSTRHMYQQARANEMVMRRLLPDLDSLGLDIAPESHQPKNLTDHPHNSIRTSDPSSVQGGLGVVSEVSSATAEPQRTKRPSQRNMGRYVSPQQTMSSKPPEKTCLVESSKGEKALTPLTMETLMKGGNVKESSGKSVLWSNYA